MAFNVLDLIQGSLTSDNIAAVAGALGMEKESAKKGLGAALPVVLAGVMGAAKTPQGRQTFDSALASADTNMLGNLGGLLSGGGGSSIIAAGSRLLSGFLGENKMGALGGALASGLGISRESSGSLLGVAAPILMSLLAGKKKSEGLDTGGLINALLGQKDAISKAIPTAISNQLKGSGILDGLAGEARASVQSTTHVAQQTAEKSGSWLRWVIGILVVLAILYFLSGLFGGDKPSDRASMVGSAELMVGGVDLGKSLQNIYGDLGSALTSITDTASARAALPDLSRIQEQLGTVERAAGSLSPAGRSALANMIEASTPTVKRAVDSLLGDSSIAPIVKPAIDDIIARLTALARG